MTLQLKPDYLALVQAILRKNGIESSVYAFGSRVRGDHRTYSDLDLVVKGDTPLGVQVLAQLKSDFECSDLPITIDVIEWSKITNEFRDKIQNDLLKLL